MNDAIVYMPHCSRCGTMLHGEVSVNEVRGKVLEYGADCIDFTNNHYEINPAVCPKCLANFGRIIYPAPYGKGFSANMDGAISIPKDYSGV